VHGGGLVAYSSADCSAPGYADIALTPEGGDHWLGAVAASAPACRAAVISDCAGTGSLEAGIKIDCAPSGAGSLGPVIVCFPGPAAPPPVFMGRGRLQLTVGLGSYAGDVDVVLAGDVGAANVCV
jgi:hypothetical protein